eukprot:2527893-Prymnesium_polylepis.2
MLDMTFLRSSTAHSCRTCEARGERWSRLAARRALCCSAGGVRRRWRRRLSRPARFVGRKALWRAPRLLLLVGAQELHQTDDELIRAVLGLVEGSLCLVANVVVRRHQRHHHLLHLLHDCRIGHDPAPRRRPLTYWCGGVRGMESVAAALTGTVCRVCSPKDRRWSGSAARAYTGLRARTAGLPKRLSTPPTGKRGHIGSRTDRGPTP